MMRATRPATIVGMALLVGCFQGTLGNMAPLGPEGDPNDVTVGDANAPADAFAPTDAGSDAESPGDPSSPADADVTPTALCAPLPPATGVIVNVSNLTELVAALAAAADNSTIVLAAGVYQHDSSLVVNNKQHLTIRGATGNRDDVVVRGPGYANDDCSPEQHGFQVWSSAYLTLTDLTIEQSTCHGVQIQPGASDHFRAYRITIRDTGQQNFKLCSGTTPPWADDGEFACSEVSFTTGSLPYNNGVDLHRVWRWHVHDNTFRNLRALGASAQSGPSILIWNGSADTVVERNLLINCWQGISLGMHTDSSGTIRTPGFQHVGGVIRNNVVINMAGLDAGIIVGSAKGVAVSHNTVWNPDYWASIESSGSGDVGADKNLFYNNLVTTAVALRFGDSTATTTIAGSVVVSDPAQFVTLAAGDAHLVSGAAAINAAVPLPTGLSVPADIDGEARPQGAAADVGADEWLP
jgi:hypothetical protein